MQALEQQRLRTLQTVLQQATQAEQALHMSLLDSCARTSLTAAQLRTESDIQEFILKHAAASSVGGHSLAGTASATAHASAT